ncbi:hypothetical protein ACTMU2_39130 [Cupriavidus basilensis]
MLARLRLSGLQFKNVARHAAQIYELPAAMAHDLVPVIDEALNENPLAPGRLRIAWVIPGLIIGGGGHRNILRAAYFLSQFGHQVSLYFTGTEKDPHTIKRQIQEHFYPIDCPVIYLRANFTRLMLYSQPTGQLSTQH